MQIETERLILRPWEDGDAASLYKYACDPRVGPPAGWPPHTSVENSLEIIHSVLSEPETYAVVPKKTGEAVGSVGIMLGGHGSAPMLSDEAEVGCWIGVPFWGQGMIPEAIKALLSRCFEQLDKNGVWYGYYDGNDKSKRVSEKCGFVYHHTARGVISPLGDTRDEHFAYLTRKRFLESRDASAMSKNL